jgi:WD40 repeat protein
VDIESAKGLVAVLVTDTDGEEILTSEQSKMANVMIEDSGIGSDITSSLLPSKRVTPIRFSPPLSNPVFTTRWPSDHRRQGTQRYNW